MRSTEQETSACISVYFRGYLRNHRHGDHEVQVINYLTARRTASCEEDLAGEGCSEKGEMGGKGGKYAVRRSEEILLWLGGEELNRRYWVVSSSKAGVATKR